MFEPYLNFKLLSVSKLSFDFLPKAKHSLNTMIMCNELGVTALFRTTHCNGIIIPVRCVFINPHPCQLYVFLHALKVV